MSKMFRNSIIFLFLGILSDTITTIIGASLGYVEQNPFGLKQVLIANILLLIAVIILFFIYPKNIKSKKLFFSSTVIFYTIGTFRFIVAISNIVLIAGGIR